MYVEVEQEGSTSDSTKRFRCMPELLLDTVFEAAEDMSTGGDLGESSSTTSKTNGLSISRHMSSPKNLQNYVTSETSTATFKDDSLIKTMPKSIELDEIKTIDEVGQRLNSVSGRHQSTKRNGLNLNLNKEKRPSPYLNHVTNISSKEHTSKSLNLCVDYKTNSTQSNNVITTSVKREVQNMCPLDVHVTSNKKRTNHFNIGAKCNVQNSKNGHEKDGPVDKKCNRDKKTVNHFDTQAECANELDAVTAF